MTAPPLPAARKPILGEQARDRLTGITGVFIAFTDWHDRSAECAILREGCDADGKPFEPHWFPLSRLEAA